MQTAISETPYCTPEHLRRRLRPDGVLLIEGDTRISMAITLVAKTGYPTLEALLTAVRDCRACEGHLPPGPRPVLRTPVGACLLSNRGELFGSRLRTYITL